MDEFSYYEINYINQSVLIELEFLFIIMLILLILKEIYGLLII